MLNKKLNFYQQQIDKVNFLIKKNNVLITYFIYKKEELNNFENLDIFCHLHLLLNPELEIIIFTNQKNLSKNLKISSMRIHYFKLEIYDDKFIDTRTIINYLIFDKFKYQKYLYIFDFDILPFRSYLENLQVESVGLTCQSRKRNVDFSYNGGFMVVNCSNRSALLAFKKIYFDAYLDAIQNQKKYLINYQSIDKNCDLSYWWGDQVAFNNILGKIKFLPTYRSLTFIKKEVKFTIFNEDLYNFQPKELNSVNQSDEELFKFLDKISNFNYLIHLTGSKKFFIKKIYAYLLIKYQVLTKVSL